MPPPLRLTMMIKHFRLLCRAMQVVDEASLSHPIQAAAKFLHQLLYNVQRAREISFHTLRTVRVTAYSTIFVSVRLDFILKTRA
jgi:hypothetical protein